MTRKLTIRTKLAAALAVPLIALAAFAAFQVRDAYNRADQAKRQAGLATAASRPDGVLSALENERDYEALWAIGAQDLVDPGLQTSGDATSRTNAALTSFRQQLHDLGGDAAGNYQATLAAVSGRLAEVRKDAQQHASKVKSPATAQVANRIYDKYTEIIQQVLDVDQRTGTAINDSSMRNGAELLNAIARQNDVERQLVVRAMLATIAHDGSWAFNVQQLAGTQTATTDTMAVLGQDEYASAVAPTLTSKPRAAIANTLAAVVRDPLHVDTTKLYATSTATTKLWRVPQTNVSNLVTARAQHLTSAAQDAQRNWMIVTIASILLAIATLWLANKWITKPLRQLAKQAGTMAGERLPAAVQEILETPLADEVRRPEVEPVQVKAGGEVREVAYALNRVQDSAIELAVEQAQLRGNVADAFVNLGRRNQNLLSRQLEFITQLENSESDPETLEHLFRLDHLATRMRRNAESLLVLAGHEPPRTWTAPVEIGDVVRGALGEVEGYQRVRLRHLDDAEVDGAAAVDVSHVVAELVENALSFSPPDSDVEVYGRSDDYGYVITIVDHGIGMTAEDLAHANELITHADARTFAPSRFLGHYVVAQLARRHGLDVTLTASPDAGLTALIALPAQLVGRDTPEALLLLDVEPVPLVAEENVARPVEALPRRASAVTREDEDPRDEVPVEQPDAPVEVAPVAPAPLALVPQPEPEPEPEPEATDPIAFGATFAAEFFGAARAATEGAAPPEPAAAEVEPAPEPELEPEPEPPVAPAKPRIGIGTFADLRATSAPPTPRGAPSEPETPPASAPVAPVPVVAEPARPGPSRAAAFAEVASAVETVTGTDPGPSVPASVFAEDLLPQRLPKRGRRASKLSAPWSREKPAKPVVAPAPAPAPAPAAAPPAPVLPSSSPPSAPAAEAAPAPPAPASGALHFPPGGPAMTANGHPDAAAPAPEGRTNTEEDRFAFFAAFRAAAEQAREEAGIDDRRVGQ